MPTAPFRNVVRPDSEPDVRTERNLGFGNVFFPRFLHDRNSWHVRVPQPNEKEVGKEEVEDFRNVPRVGVDDVLSREGPFEFRGEFFGKVERVSGFSLDVIGKRLKFRTGPERWGVLKDFYQA